MTKGEISLFRTGDMLECVDNHYKPGLSPMIAKNLIRGKRYKFICADLSFIRPRLKMEVDGFVDIFFHDRFKAPAALMARQFPVETEIYENLYGGIDG